jgi:hypothetical protein
VVLIFSSLCVVLIFCSCIALIVLFSLPCSLGIALVCSGVVGCDDPTDSYAEARRRGIWRQIASPLALTSSDVINRILANYAKYAGSPLFLFVVALFF